MRASPTTLILRLLLAALPVIGPVLHRGAHSALAKSSQAPAIAAYEDYAPAASHDSESCELCALFANGFLAAANDALLVAALPVTAERCTEQVVCIRRDVRPDAPRAPPV